MNRLFFFFLTALLLAGCAQEESGDRNSEDITPGSAQAEAAPRGQFAKPQPADQSPEAQALCQNYWVFEFFVTDDRDARLFNRGRWYDFREDGTFLSGHWEEQKAEGSWRLIRSKDRTVVAVDGTTGKPLDNSPYELRLAIDSSNDSEDGTYILTFNSAMDASSWVGLPKTPVSGIAIKAINLFDRPTKEQFGLE